MSNFQEMKQIIASKIDHAVLKPTDTEKDVEAACEIAKKYNIASLCVKPSHVHAAKKHLENSGVKVCTVVGFPHGANTSEIKCAEAVEAISLGAGEIDMVINISKVIEGDLDYLTTEIDLVAKHVHQAGGILKVIIETSLLNDKQKELASKVAEIGGADYVKTSTGFAGGGATLEDINLIKSVISDKTKMKASGGIKTFEQAAAFIEAGCDRLGTSNTEHILNNIEAQNNY